MAICLAKDNSFKQILGNNQLFVEFLKDFIPSTSSGCQTSFGGQTSSKIADIFKDITPDDIEDVSLRFIPLFEENRDSDTVKQINLKNQSPLFVIAIVEHESGVNFRSCFKMLQYIILVLDDFEKKLNAADPGASLRKDFKYPPVIPIVFHDGPGAWTAETNFLNRTALSEVFEKYIPKFEYEVVSLSQYPPEELARFNDTLSLVMLIDRIGTMQGKNILKELPPDYLERIALKIPENLNKLLSDVVTTLLDRFGAEEAEIVEITDYIVKKEITTMFDAMVERYWKMKDEGRDEGYKEAEAKYQDQIRQDQDQIRQAQEEIRQLREQLGLHEI